MINKDQLLASMKHDCQVALHLHSKLTPDTYDYRPTPGQRSTTELLRYLSHCAIGAVRCMTADSWDGYGEFVERAGQMAPEDFPAAMERQVAELEATFASLSEADLETKEAPMPGGGRMPLGLAIFNAPAKWLTAYKMQLFLYAKAAGKAELGTANAWAGMDPPPQDPA